MIHSEPKLAWLTPREAFPDPQEAWGTQSEAPGLLAAGGVLDAPTILDAYRRGIFPWFSAGQPGYIGHCRLEWIHYLGALKWLSVGKNTNCRDGSTKMDSASATQGPLDCGSDDFDTRLFAVSIRPRGAV